jgi:hypothetical protein
MGLEFLGKIAEVDAGGESEFCAGILGESCPREPDAGVGVSGGLLRSRRGFEGVSGGRGARFTD